MIGAMNYRPHTRTFRLRGLFLAAIASIAIASTAATARADTTTTLPADGFGTIAVDDAHAHVFISGDFNRGATTISIADSSGALVGQIDNEPGASGMVVVGSTLFVGLCDSGAIDLIDTTTLARTGSVAVPIASPTPAGLMPHDQCQLAAAGGRIWFAAQAADGTPEMASMAIAAPHAVRTYPAMAVPTDMATTPSHPNRLLVSDIYRGAGTVLYDVSTSPPTVLGSEPLALSPIVMFPSGNAMVGGDPRCCDNFQLLTFSLPGFTQGAAYQTPNRPSAAVAVSPDGAHVAATVVQYGYDPSLVSLRVWPTGSATPSLTAQVGIPGTYTPAFDGLAYRADGQALYAVDYHWMDGGSATLRTVDRPDLGGSDLTLQAPVGITVGTGAALSGQLTLQDGSAAGGETIALSATSPDGQTEPLGEAVTDADGGYSLTPAQTFGSTGTWTVHASWSGDAQHRAAEQSASLPVASRASQLTLRRRTAVIRIGAGETLTAHLAAHHSSGAVSIYATPAGATQRLIASGSVDGSGNLSVHVSPKRDTVYTASYAGDDWYAPDHARTSIGVRVLVQATMLGGYATSRGTRLYHYTSSCPGRHRGCPVAAVAVKPNVAGEVVGFTLQIRAGGHWHPIISAKPRLGRRSRARITIVYRSTSIIGHKLRVVWHFDDQTHHGADAARTFMITG